MQLPRSVQLFTGILFSILVTTSFCTAQQQLRVAVIGGGIAGASFTHFVQQSFQNESITLDIDIYDRNTTFGGRLKTLNIDGITIEGGASIIHDLNQYVKNFTMMLNLTRSQPQLSNKHMGIWNGKQFVFQTSNYQLVTIGKMLWRYGFDLLTIQSSISAIAHQFSEFYTVQRNGSAFKTVEELTSSVGLYELTQTTLKEYIEAQIGTDTLVANELAVASTRVNYGQSLNLSGLAGAVGLIPFVSGSSALFNVLEGNEQIPTRLIVQSGANQYLQHTITKIAKLSTGHRISGINEQQQSFERDYDIVVIATPLEIAGIEFESYPNSFDIPARKFQQTFTTFIKGRARPAFFNQSCTTDQLPASILTTETIDVPFTSLTSYHRNSSTGLHIYKMFSRTEPTPSFFSRLFGSDYSIIHSFAWSAYPSYSAPEQFASFQLQPTLYYINAFENTASCMEVEAVAAKNVASLLYQQWRERAIEDGKIKTSGSKVASHHHLIKEEL